MRANSSRSYCVMRPDGKTSHRFPAIVIVRVGILLQLHFMVDPGGVDEVLWSPRHRIGERVLILCFDELNVRTGQITLLEHPELAIRPGVVQTTCPQALHELLPVGRRYDRPLESKCTCHS